MMDQRHVYPSNFTELLAVSAYQQNMDRLSSITVGEEKYQETYPENEVFDNPGSESPSTEDGDSTSSQSFGVDLSGKSTNLAGKSFTIAAILGLSNTEEDVMSQVQERLQQNQRQLQNYLYAGHDVQRLNDGYCRTLGPPSLRQDSPRQDIRPQQSQIKTTRNSLPCSNSGSRSKRIRTIFTPEQLERLEAEFERQQYMVGPERLYLAHALQLTEAQVKVWFQNRRIKWRKHHLEVTQQRLAVLQRHRPAGDDDI